MKANQIASLIFATVLLSAALVNAAPIAIAGSELSAPPSFWTDSFYPLTQSIDRAFPFHVVGEQSYRLGELQIAAYHYDFLPGSRADFTIHQDDGGVPGLPITEFHFSGISTTPRILSSSPTINAVLHANTPYWIVGETSQRQVNWNLADSIFGRTAYRVAGDDWIIQESRNIAAFAILGSPTVPEPSAMVLTAIAGLVLWHFRKRPATLVNSL